MRRQSSLQPRRLDEITSALKALERFAEIKEPREAEEPILAGPVRRAIFEWLTEIRAVEDLAAVGIKPRRSALLFGPPGCGKTTLAHHLAARLGLPLVAVQSEQLIDASLGGSGKNVAALFQTLARIDGQAVVLLDEIDAIGSARSSDDQACAREMNAVLTVLLRHVEGFNGIAIAATNRQDSLDAALWRRFGMQISVDLPGPDERFAIIRRYLSPFDLPDGDIDLLVDLTASASPALLRGLIEGVKRSLVLGERLRQPVDDPVAIFSAIAAAARPHPDYDQPPLWDGEVSALAALSWPPIRKKEIGDA